MLFVPLSVEWCSLSVNSSGSSCLSPDYSLCLNMHTLQEYAMLWKSQPTLCIIRKHCGMLKLVPSQGVQIVVICDKSSSSLCFKEVYK